MKLKKSLAGLLVVAMAFVLAACGKSTTTASKQEFNVATTAEMATLNPAKYSDQVSSEAIQNAYEGLYRFDKNNKPVLAGATKVTSNKNKTVYTFTLRRDAKWSNGDSVTAQDYVYAWRQVVNPKTASPNATHMDPIKNATKIRSGKMAVDKLGVKAIGKYTLQVTLESPIEYFAEMLTGAPFMPVDYKVAQKYGSQYGTSSDKAVYNGAFTVSGWTGTNDTWAYVKNNSYYGKNEIKLSKVNVSVQKDTTTAANLYQTNKIDYMLLGNQYVSQYQGYDGFHSKAIPLIGYLGFNTKKSTTGNVHVRKALAEGYDRALLVKKVLNAGSVLNGIVPSKFVYNPTTKEDYRKLAGDMLSYNLADAKKQWALAKKQLGKSKITIELLSSDTTEAKQVVEYMQSQLEKNLPGLTITVRSIPLKSRLQATTNYNFDVVYGTWTPDYADPVNFIADGGAYHLSTDYTNKTYWNDLNAAATTYANNPVKRWQKLVDAERQLVQQDVFTAPVYQGAMTYLLKSKVHGLQISPYGTILFYRNVYIK